MTGRTFLAIMLAASAAALGWLLLAPSFFMLVPLVVAVTVASVTIAGGAASRMAVAGHAVRALVLICWATSALAMVLGPFVPLIGENAGQLASSFETHVTGGQQLIPWAFLPFVALCGWSLWRGAVRLVAGLRRPIDWACLALGPLAALGTIVFGFLAHLLILVGALKFAGEPDMQGIDLLLAWLPLIVAGSVLCADLWRGTLPLVPHWPDLAMRQFRLLRGSLLACTAGGVGLALAGIAMDRWPWLLGGSYVALTHGFILWQGHRAISIEHWQDQRTSGLMMLLLMLDAALAIFASVAIAATADQGPTLYDFIVPPFVLFLGWKMHHTISDWRGQPIGKARDFVRQPVPSTFRPRTTSPEA